MGKADGALLGMAVLFAIVPKTHGTIERCQKAGEVGLSGGK